MSASNEWTEWHLTPSGWVEGSSKTDFGQPKIVEGPSDSVASYKWKEHLSSVFSQPARAKVEYHEIEDSTMVRELLKKYGPGPEHL